MISNIIIDFSWVHKNPLYKSHQPSFPLHLGHKNPPKIQKKREG